MTRAWQQPPCAACSAHGPWQNLSASTTLPCDRGQYAHLTMRNTCAHINRVPSHAKNYTKHACRMPTASMQACNGIILISSRLRFMST